MPSLIIQLLMLLLVLSYYLHWPTSVILVTLSGWRDQSAKLVPWGDLYFNFISTGLASGVLAEVCKVYLTQKGSWTRQNLQDGAFKFCVIGLGGLNAGLFYHLQGLLFGTQVSVHSVALKVIVDQFVFNPLLAAPFPCIINHCLIFGFSRKTLAECFSVPFYLEKVCPLLFTTWCFWLPTVSLIYSLPLLLQFPLFLCASTIWGLIFTALINPDAGEGGEDETADYAD